MQTFRKLPTTPPNAAAKAVESAGGSVSVMTAAPGPGAAAPAEAATSETNERRRRGRLASIHTESGLGRAGRRGGDRRGPARPMQTAALPIAHETRQLAAADS